jgi:hypothetical protein
VSAWLDWIDEPLRQPPDLHLVRPPVTGPVTRQTQAQATTLPPTLAPATAVRPTSTSAPQPTATPAAVLSRATPRPASTAAATAVPLTGQQRRVANTDGQGVALRDGPGGGRLPAKGYDEGEVVTVLEQQGTWTRIRGQDGREGWVLSVTLSP